MFEAGKQGFAPLFDDVVLAPHSATGNRRGHF
jgi:hypothetical protein